MFILFEESVVVKKVFFKAIKIFSDSEQHTVHNYIVNHHKSNDNLQQERNYTH